MFGATEQVTATARSTATATVKLRLEHYNHRALDYCKTPKTDFRKCAHLGTFSQILSHIYIYNRTCVIPYMHIFLK